MQDTPEQRVAHWSSHVTELLGRQPRGFRDVVAFDINGQPAVIRVASVVGGKPFPTLFWLVDPRMNLTLDRMEARGVIADLQRRVDLSADLRASMLEDHAKHKRLRVSYLTRTERSELEAKGMMAALDDRGIGGIAGSDRIRCLHTWYAAHLVCPNTIGRLIDQYVSQEGR